jgi:8-oxo-dGTP diphosphatase
MDHNFEVMVELLPPRSVPEPLLTYVVMGARFKKKWVFVRHRDRASWEMPAGHIERGESADRAAVRELYEEAGVSESALEHLCDYSVQVGENTEYGRCYAAQVKALDATALEHEIGELEFFERLPDQLTYPEVQTILFGKLREHFNLQDQS